MNARSLETLLLDELTRQQGELVRRVFGKQHGHPHEEYIRLNGEWWGLENAKKAIAEVVKKADI